MNAQFFLTKDWLGIYWVKRKYYIISIYEACVETLPCEIRLKIPSKAMKNNQICFHLKKKWNTFNYDYFWKNNKIFL